MKTFKFLLLVISMASQCFIAHAQSTTYEGKDFWVGFMPNSDATSNYLKVFISAKTASSATITIPQLSATPTIITIPANGIATHRFPNVFAGKNMGLLTPNVISKTGIHIVSDNDIAVYGFNEYTVSTDGWLTLPTVGLGNEYLSVGFCGNSANITPAEFLVVATENNTTINFTMPATMSAIGHAAGSSWSVTLNKGETYLTQANGVESWNFDLTGVQINSDKPIAVFSGAAKSNYPEVNNKEGFNDAAASDHMVEMLTPLNTWGGKYIAIALGPNSPTNTMQDDGSFIRIVSGSTNSFPVSIAGYPTFTLNGKGDYKDIQISSTKPAFVYSPANKISVYLIMASGSAYSTDLDGDPCLINVIAEEQWGKVAFFLTPIGQSGTAHTYSPSGEYVNYFSIVTRGNTNTITYDGAPVTGLIAVPGTPYFYKTYSNVASGIHTIVGTEPLVVYEYGTMKQESYGMPVTGSGLKNVVLSNSLVKFNVYEKQGQWNFDYTLNKIKDHTKIEILASKNGVNYESVFADNLSTQEALDRTTIIQAQPHYKYFKLKVNPENTDVYYSNIRTLNLNSTIQTFNAKMNAGDIELLSEFSEDIKSISLINAQGQLIKTWTAAEFLANSNSGKVEMGVYFLTIESHSGEQRLLKLINQ